MWATHRYGLVLFCYMATRHIIIIRQWRDFNRTLVTSSILSQYLFPSKIQLQPNDIDVSGNNRHANILKGFKVLQAADGFRGRKL